MPCAGVGNRGPGAAAAAGRADRRAGLGIAPPPALAPAIAAPSRNDRPPLGQEERGQERQQRSQTHARSPRAVRRSAAACAAAATAADRQPQITMQEPQLPPVRDRAGRRAAVPTTAPRAPGVRGFRDITADADDLGRAAAQANRAARKTYANVPSPSPEFDRLEPSLEDRGADPEAPYSYDESIEEADRYAAPPPAPRPRIASDRDREQKRARAGAVFPFKSAIAIGIVLILVGAAILWGRSVVTGVSGLFKSQPAVETPKDNRRS